MARVTTYLNFMGNAKEAFEFYKQLFGTDYSMPFMYMKDVPVDPAHPLPESESNSVMHVALPILAGHVLMGTDMLKSMGHELKIGNNTTINLEPDSIEELDRLYKALSDGAKECSEPAHMFWGAYWGTCLDRFGIRWMFNYYTEPN